MCKGWGYTDKIEKELQCAPVVVKNKTVALGSLALWTCSILSLPVAGLITGGSLAIEVVGKQIYDL